MRHHAFVAAFTFAIAALFSTQPQAAALDPVGVWLKEDGKAKMSIRKCGRNQLCSRIVWLKDPNDSNGKPLRDARNENTSLRNREIMGLPIFNGLTPAGVRSWSGAIYNPEDGNTYKATLTLVSSRQIVLKGCKAFGLLCGQKSWTRSKLDDEPAQIEAANEPEKPEKPKVQTAAVVPAPAPEATAPQPVPAPKPQATAQLDGGEPVATEALPRAQPMAQHVVFRPELPHPAQDAKAGFGVITTTAVPKHAPPFTSEKPSTMFAMTPPPGAAPPTPAAGEAMVEEAALSPEAEQQAAVPIPLPDHKPKVVPRPRPQAAVKPKPKRETLPWLR